MTVKQLLGWCIQANRKHEASYNGAGKYNICKKQALMLTKPDSAMGGECDLALTIMFSCSIEDRDIRFYYDSCYEPSPPRRAQPAAQPQPVEQTPQQPRNITTWDYPVDYNYEVTNEGIINEERRIINERMAVINEGLAAIDNAARNAEILDNFMITGTQGTACPPEEA